MKRSLDLIASTVLLIVLSPIFAAVSVLIAFRMGRPVFFCQKRVGLHGQVFTMFKFRTMMSSCDDSGKLLPDEQRLTSLGRFLRSTSIDELPELWNVIRGQMSLVGPRPLHESYLDRYTSEQARRHLVLPGITGWAQVHGRNATTWEERFKLDTWYVDNQSIFLDLKIIAKTLIVVIARQGVSSAGHATMPEFNG